MVTSRAEAIADAFLVWLAAQGAAMPPEGFLAAPGASPEGEAVSARELEEVLTVLSRRGLVEHDGTGPTTDVPRLARLTAAGRLAIGG